MIEMAFSVLPGGDGYPKEPDWTTIFTDDLDVDVARVTWRETFNEMRDAGTLSLSNGHAIKRLAEFRVQFERASRHVGEEGAILPPANKKTKVGQWNPYWSVMRQADDAIKSLESELGLSPRRRAGAAKAERKVKQVRAADAYLARG
jgi:phage terminase small subunit